MCAPERALRSLLMLLVRLAACGLCIVPAASAQSAAPSADHPPVPTDPRSFCTGDALDFRLVHNPFSQNPAPGHLLAILIHNRGAAPCILPPATLDLFSTTQTPPSQSRDTDYAGPINLSTDRWSLEPGQFAHILLAWSSAPERVTSRNILDCTTNESLALRAQGSPWLTVHSLYIRPCGDVWVSPYRAGVYTPSEPILQSWMDRYQLQITAVLPTFEPAFLTPQQSKTFTLASLSPVRYLKGLPNSGYTGVFTLWLTARTNCPYFQLSKREANGETIVQINNCNDTAALAATAQSALYEIGLSNNRMLPQRAGRVEYTVESYAPQPKPRVETSLLPLDIHAPADPTVPSIDTRLRPCTAAQLALSPQPVDLGTHWDKPRSFADDEKQWHDGRAFNFTNTSPETCLVGGVPDLHALNPPDMTTGSLAPEICRNCDNPVFAARDSHWIELKPAQTSHFLVSRTVFDQRYQGLCMVIGGLDLLQSGRPIYLPFETASCAPVNVSAWREGPYDTDPLNLAYNPAHPQLTDPGTIPEQCAQDITPDTGQPIFPFSGSRSNWGISTQPAAFGQPVPLIIWIDNPTDQPLPVTTCNNLDYFFIYSIDIYDISGHRVHDKQQETTAHATSAPERPFSCTSNMTFTIPAHTCSHGNFSQRVFRDLTTRYTLPPGRYSIAPSTRTPNNNTAPITLPDTTPRLPLTITPE
ncbi:MAG TPA: hypothetical protein VGN01_05030 [Acidobacteriaceae bacterium]